MIKMRNENDMNLNNPFNHDFWDGNRRSFRPWFDGKADYNTNAASYYDYSAHLGAYLDQTIKLINRLQRRNLEVKDTNTVDLTREGDWRGKLCCGDDDHKNDIETISADVKVSKVDKNAIKVNTDGLYVFDFADDIADIYTQIKNLGDQINQIFADLDAFKKLLINLKSAGFWTQHDPNNIFNGDLAPDLWLMMGNMNIDSTQNGVTRSVKSNINGFNNNDLLGRL